MMNKLKKTAVLLGGVMLILIIVVWGIKHSMKPVDVQTEPETETETVTKETEDVPEAPVDYDIAANMKLKDKDGIKTLKTDHFTLTLSHGDSWDTKVNSKNSITIYNIALNKAKRGGKLVTILAFNSGDKSYDVLPDYNVIGESDGVVYIAAYPTDMQYDGGKKNDIAEYQAVFEEVCRLKAGDADNPFVFNN